MFLVVGLGLWFAFVSWAVWMHLIYRPKRYAIDHSIYDAARLGKASYNLAEFAQVESREPRFVIVRDYRIEYSSKIYVNAVFDLTVTFAKHDKLGKAATSVVRTEGKISLEAAEPEPPITVELKFPQGSFEASELSQTKRLAKDARTVFVFQLKPLKAEDLLLSVGISYSAVRPVPETIEEVTTTITVEKGNKRTTTSTATRKKPPTSRIEKMELHSIPLTVSVKAFDGLSGSELDIAKKVVGGIILLLFVAIWVLSGKPVDLNEATGLVILALVTPFGFEVPAEFIKRLKPKQQASPAKENEKQS